MGKKNVFYDILEQKKRPSRLQKQEVKKVQKFSFFQLFFKGNIVQENVIYDILERKNAFLGYKNKKFKKSKN